MMWLVRTLDTGNKIVMTAVSQGITAIFIRPLTDASIHINIFSNDAEPRLFDKNRFPSLTIDGEYNSSFDTIFSQRAIFLEKMQKVLCFVDDRSLGAVVWAGDGIGPNATIYKLMMGKSLHLRLFFHPFSTEEFNLSLVGLADALNQAFGVSTSIDHASSVSNSRETSQSSPEITVDRAAIRAMVEDHWRGFIPVAAAGNMQVTAQCIKNIEDRIRDTTALMEPHKAKIFSQAVDEERELVLNEFKRSPDALKRRLGLLPITQPAPVTIQYRRQSIGDMAVRTAIRATIWETVIALFRR
jgi:hypothetical protein